jgi:hypothetical protein
MSKRLPAETRDRVIQLLDEGRDRGSIAALLGVTPGQVSAIAAHLTMGTYGRTGTRVVTGHRGGDAGIPEQAEEETPARGLLSDSSVTACGAGLLIIEPAEVSDGLAIVVGQDVNSGELVRWDPRPDSGLANPHVLILGESGFGKTYATACLLGELAQIGIPSIVFDYAQGFGLAKVSPWFVKYARPTEIHAGREGIAINPLQIFPEDIHGPANVAQRVADTFARVYPRIGVQQHAVLRQAVLEVFQEARPVAGHTVSPSVFPPAFRKVQEKLLAYASDPEDPNRRLATSVASHISTIFVFDTFRASGQPLDWAAMIGSGGRACILQLQGLEHSLERAVTEFLLWNLVSYVESEGPGPLRCFVVLDEAHKLSFDAGSPVEKLLREGRTFGLGLILASQQPEDFSSVAFANTATKIVLQIADDRGAVSRQLYRKSQNVASYREISSLITRLPRGVAYYLSRNRGRVVRLHSFEERASRWRPREA